MTDKATEIAGLLAPTVESLGLELLGVEYLPAPGPCFRPSDPSSLQRAVRRTSASRNRRSTSA